MPLGALLIGFYLVLILFADIFSSHDYSFVTIFLIRFSRSGRLIHIWVSQVLHLMRKSIPARMMVKVLPPQGCGFFSSTMSPIFNFSGMESLLQRRTCRAYFLENPLAYNK
jgi:hypothetical protein